jgi:hypothetical protein
MAELSINEFSKDSGVKFTRFSQGLPSVFSHPYLGQMRGLEHE